MKLSGHTFQDGLEGLLELALGHRVGEIREIDIDRRSPWKMRQCDHGTFQPVWTVVMDFARQRHVARAAAVRLHAAIAQIVLTYFTGEERRE